MATLGSILTFAASVAWCARQLARSPRAATALLPLPTLLGSWVLLMTMRAPTPGRALLAFTLADLAVLVLPVLGVVRLLGGFERFPEDDADGREPEDPQPDPGPAPHPPCRSRPVSGRRPTSPRRPRPTRTASGAVRPSGPRVS